MIRRFPWIAFLGLACAPGSLPAQISPMRIDSPAFVALRVQDVEAAAHWYRDKFSLQEVRAIDAPTGEYRIRILTDGTLSVELIEATGVQDAPALHFGLFKVGLFVDDAEQALHSLRSRGVDTDASTFVDPTLGFRSFVARDPDGNRLQFFERCDGGCR